VLNKIKVDYYTGAGSRATLAFLSCLGLKFLLRPDIYNEQYRIRLMDVHGKTPIERAVEVSDENNKYWLR
jgi:hypothetical protein